MPSSPNTSATATGLSAAFSMPPEKAIAWFESLGIAIGWDWRRSWNEARALAFSLAHVADLTVLAAVREEVGRAIQQGITQAQFRKYLAGRLGALGWLSRRTLIDANGVKRQVDLSQPHRMDVIFRSNAQAAYMAGRWSEQQEQAATHPFLQYVAVMDSRTRDTHAALNGKVWRVDDPVWKTIYPPNGFNCRCRVRSLTAEQVAERGLVVADTALPDGFPDTGFAFNPGIPGAQAVALAGVTSRLLQRIASAGAPAP